MPTIAATVTAFRDRVMLATHAPNVAGVPYSLQRRPDLLHAPITIIHTYKTNPRVIRRIGGEGRINND